MLKYFSAIIFICMMPVFVLGQTNYTLKGTVSNQDNERLAGASIFLSPIEVGTSSSNNGIYLLENLPEGKYEIKVSFIGYDTFIDTLEITSDRIFDIKLMEAPVNLQEVFVNANYSEALKRKESLNIEVINDDYLKANLTGSLMKSLENLPGITTIDIGSGQSKPVIRGLGFNRVVVVENSIKHEAQQWGADHGLEIDQYAVNNIEVIKGPASLMYGSDAIGGVIDMKSTMLPRDNSFGGVVDLTGNTNNYLMGGSIMLYGRKNWFFANIRATLIDYGDYKVPTDSVDIYSYRAALFENNVRNTAGNEKNFHVSAGIIKDNFFSKFYLSSVNTKSGFFANAHGLEPRNVDEALYDKSSRDINYPFQTVNHLKVINKSEYKFEKVLIEFDLGFQRNFRQEFSQYVSHGYMPPTFPGSMGYSSDLEREFTKKVYSGNLKLSYSVDDNTEFDIGINSEKQENRINGRGFIIPAYDQISFGAFSYLKYNLNERNLIQLGVRFDYGNIDTYEYHDWFSSPVIENNDTTMVYLQRAENINRRFSNITWSIGYNYNLEKWAIKANVGKSFRIPIAKELAANGVNYHHFSYEVGDKDLSPEESYQFDAGLEFNSRSFEFGVTPFINYFSNYIYLNPSSEHDRLYGNGNQIYYYTQSRVLRYGTEIYANYRLIDELVFGVNGEYVYSEQLSGSKKGFTLPFSPPASAILNVKYQSSSIKYFDNFYISLDYRLTASQSDIVPPEEPTDGFQVVTLKSGGDLNVNNQKISIAFQIQNLFNTKYFNHTSFYRLINVPEPGRNFIINISIPFGME